MKNRLLLPAALGLVFACSKAETAPQTRTLTLIPSLEDGYQTKATVADVPSLNERALSGGMTVFISGHGVFRRYTISAPQADRANFLTRQWKYDGIMPGYTYDVHAVANPPAALSHIESEAALKALDTGVDSDIYRLYDPQAGSYDLSRTASKLFLMDATCKWTPTTELEQTLSVTLKRAVAKIEIHFSLSPSLSGYALYGKPQWKWVNYATCAAILQDGRPADPCRRTTPYMMDVHANTATEGFVTTYTYPHTWTDADDATMVILNVPLQDSQGNIIRNNYYAIPVADISGPGPYSLERNTQYRVHAQLETLGSSGENASEPPAGLFYEVIPWTYRPVVDDILVVGQEVDYLMVDPTEEEIREKVLSGGHGPKTLQLNYWSSGPVSVTAAEVYYYDKDNNKVDAAALSPVTVAVRGTDSGTIDVTSTALSNNAVKFIRFRAYLTADPEQYKEIIIRHYPLDYIQNVEGLWSSLSLSGWVNWTADQALHSPQKTCSNSLFQAKVYDGGKIRRIEERRQGSSWYARAGDSFSQLHNNRMYVVQITSTSDDYTVGRVTLDADHMSAEHRVSPAFLIASQLGATSAISNARTAAAHCRNYREVTTDGRIYDNWRLPTREEIGIIMGYQYTSDTIDEVLSGSHYWTLEGKAVSKTNPSNPSGDAASGYVRCLRDLGEAELEQINVLN